MKLLSACLVAVLISVIAFAGAMQFGTAQNFTAVTGIISADITWTQANSPYNLTGPVGIADGVTLTIEPGAIVNLGSYYIQVNGTLYALGSNTRPIYFNGGTISFTSISNSWNEQTATGCIIENAILDSTTINIQNASLKISSNTLINTEINGNGDSSTISYNTFTDGGISDDGAATITNNIINGHNAQSAAIDVTSWHISNGFPVVSNNTLNGEENGDMSIGFGISCDAGYAVVSDNSISGFKDGIFVASSTDFTGQWPPYPLIEGNKIADNSYGINVIYTSLEPLIEGQYPVILNNTFFQNAIGMYILNVPVGATTIIQNNNIEDNSNYTIYLGPGAIAPNNINATYNWWGTTDTQAINQTIYDFKDDFNLGTVNFVPFLTTPNPDAPSQDYNPNPTSTSPLSPTPTPSTTISNSTHSSTPTTTSTPTSPFSSTPTITTPQNPISIYEILIAVLVILIVAFVIVMAVLIRGKRR